MSDEAESPAGPGLDRSRIDDGLYEPFNPTPMVWGAAADGLPTPEVPTHLPLAPALAPETFVCLPDESEFVIRRKGWGDIVARFKPHEILRSEAGAPYVTLEQALHHATPWIEIWRRLDLRTGRVSVEALRPQCKFLAQQLTDFQDNTEHQFMERLCTARRDDERFFVGLRDTQIHACELREPRDRTSDERIRTLNNTKIELGRQRCAESGEKFNVDEALRAAEKQAVDEGLTHSTIFADKR